MKNEESEVCKASIAIFSRVIFYLSYGRFVKLLFYTMSQTINPFFMKISQLLSSVCWLNQHLAVGKNKTLNYFTNLL